MKIMVISPTNIFPPVHGGPSRTYYFCKYLARSHEILLVSPPGRNINAECTLPVSYSELNRPGRIPQFFDPLFVSRAARLIKRERPDVVQIEFVWPGFHGHVLRMFTGVPLVVNEHNVEFVRRRRMKSPIWPALFLYEALICRYADLVFCVSEHDRNTLAGLGVPMSRTVIVPNGVDTEVFYPSDRTPSYDRLGLDRRPTVLFFGALEYLPNRQAVDIIITELLPRVLEYIPNVRFLIVGRNPPKDKATVKGDVVFTGAVDRIQDFINAADVCICPLRIGGGTRLKIIESLSCGKPVISTRVGAEGLVEEAIAHGVTIADQWDDFAYAIADHLRNRKMIKVTDAFLETYSWERIVERSPYNNSFWPFLISSKSRNDRFASLDM